jgi:hypothetical protein
LQDNLRYEGDILTEKLIKLRSTRQDLEAELFSLKDKRIKLLDVIGHLEDEEMQLVSEVGGAAHCWAPAADSSAVHKTLSTHLASIIPLPAVLQPTLIPCTALDCAAQAPPASLLRACLSTDTPTVALPLAPV